MIRPLLQPLSMRRALARISVTVVPGVSSTMKLISARVLAPSMMAPCSSGAILAERMRESGILASDDSRRWPTSSLLISSEKKATVVPVRAALVARLRPSEVLPTPGRAPTTTIWPGRRPISSESKPGKPVFTPLSPSGLAIWAAIWSLTSIMIWPMSE